MLDGRTVVSAPMGEDDIINRLEQPSEILGVLINAQILSACMHRIWNDHLTPVFYLWLMKWLEMCYSNLHLRSFRNR